MGTKQRKKSHIKIRLRSGSECNLAAVVDKASLLYSVAAVLNRTFLFLTCYYASGAFLLY